MSDTAELLIAIEDAGPRGQITLRGDLGSFEIRTALEQVMRCDVPAPLAHSDGKAVWMSPDELLLFVPYAETAAKAEALSQKLAGTHHMAQDVSDARTVLRLAGPLVGEVLAKGVPVDTTIAGFAPGTARRTHLGGLAVALWRVDAETWEIACFRSYAHHLRNWLEATAVPGSEVGWA